MPIATCCTAYDHSDGKTYILVYHQTLYMGDKQEPSLLCPNQMRRNGLIVHDCPISLSHDNLSTHTIQIPEQDLTIPLELDGIISYISTRLPTKTELEDCVRIDMTGPEEWIPSEIDLSREEKIMTAKQNERGFASVRSSLNTPEDVFQLGMHRQSEVFATLTEVSPVLADDDFITGLVQSVKTTVKSAQAAHVAAAKSTRYTPLTPDVLAKKWGIGVETAARTLKVTTQKGLRQAVHPISRRYRTQHSQYRYNHLKTTFYADTMFSKTKSLNGNTCAHVFVNDINFSNVTCTPLKSDAWRGLNELFDDVGIPAHLHTDGAKELTLGKWKETRQVKGGDLKQTVAEPYSPWQNRAESEIKELKKCMKRIMSIESAPKCLWDYAAKLACEIRRRTAHPLWKLDGRTPMEVVTGETPDISEFIQFHFYQMIWYYETPDDISQEVRRLGRMLGPAHRVGQAMCYYILPVSGEVISRSTVAELTKVELMDPAIHKRIQTFDDALKGKLDRDFTADAVVGDDPTRPLRLLDLDEDEFKPYEAEAVMPEADDFSPDTYDKYVTAQVLLPQGDTMQTATVTKRMKDIHGNPVGVSHQNPLLDTRMYEVAFPDGTVQSISTNLLAEHLYSQVDAEGNQYLLMEEILEHKIADNAVAREDMYVKTAGSNQHYKKTTQGWKLSVLWKDGTTTWIPLKDMKDSFPVEVAEYAANNKLLDEPAFIWWAKEILRKRDRIISKVKARYWKRTHKFGIKLPKSVEEAYEFDRISGTDFWKKAIEKEMRNVTPAFKFLDPDKPHPKGYQNIECHMIFDIKMDFTRKARLVAGGHTTDPPATLTYASVVSRESVRIALTVAALNDLDVLACDITSAYLNAECKERIICKVGLEFGTERKGQYAILVRALYGLKSSANAWRSHLAQTMSDLLYVPCRADPDVWMKPGFKPDGTSYWQYVLIYTDDILSISHEPHIVMEALADCYSLKKDPDTGKTYDKPKRYLGANVGDFHVPDRVDNRTCWFLSADDYVKAAIANVEKEFAKTERKLFHKADTPMSTSYRPELDDSLELADSGANYYQNLIGVLRWAVELGRIDIHLEVALLSQYLACPRQGHLEAVFRIFSYLKRHSRSKVVLDDTFIVWTDRFVEPDWSDLYPDAAELLPPNMPTPRGKAVQLNVFVDADHASNRVTRRSHTGILIYLNRAPIVWFSKRQNTVETSTFGSEFVSLKIATDMIEGLRYKLRMMGIPLEGPANVFCDNEAVVTSATRPESMLKKKHVSVCYHRVREGCASGMMRVAKEHTDTNLSDGLTKVLGAPRRKYLFEKILY